MQQYNVVAMSKNKQKYNIESKVFIEDIDGKSKTLKQNAITIIHMDLNKEGLSLLDKKR